VHYAEAWLTRARPRLEGRTAHTYRFVLDRYVLPTLGAYELDQITRAVVDDWLTELGARTLGVATIRLALAVASMILNAALDAELVTRNPCARLGRRYRKRRVKLVVYDHPQMTLFLTTATRITAEMAVFYGVCGRAGLRPGEARGLRAEDCDCRRRTIAVERQVHRNGDVGPPKANSYRVVDMSKSLIRMLEPLVKERRTGPLFPHALGADGYRRMREGMQATAAVAGLRALPTRHLRHSFASILIARGESPEYVRRQLGHVDLRLVIQLYGCHLPMRRARSMDHT
jgi:integrase